MSDALLIVQGLFKEKALNTVTVDKGRSLGCHPVIEIIRYRLGLSDTEPTNYSEVKIGLAIEGGGMRGVITGGMVAALEDAGATNIFDDVYGTSAGAHAGAYFVAGQAKLGTSIYYESINNDKFVNMWNALSSDPIVSIEFLVDQVMQFEKVLQLDEIRKSSTRLHIGVTDVESGRTEIFSNFESDHRFWSLMRATAKMPTISSGAEELGNKKYLDGGLLHQIPHRMALEDGCTHVLVLTARCLDWPVKAWGLAEEISALFLLLRYGNRMFQVQRQARPLMHREVNQLRELVGQPDVDLRLYPVFISDHIVGTGTKFPTIGRVERSANILQKGAKYGYDSVIDAIFGTKEFEMDLFSRTLTEL